MTAPHAPADDGAPHPASAGDAPHPASDGDAPHPAADDAAPVGLTLVGGSGPGCVGDACAVPGADGW